ncbi:MAG TPA: sulfite exporter TauE/SafE family protein [Acidimicrobiales bacterium]
MVLTGGDHLLLVAAGLGAGVVNGAAGGGTLLSFPALLAVGYPAVTANVTSTVGIWSGYLGGVAGFQREARSQGRRLRALAPSTLAGSAGGGVLLLTTPSHAFATLAPYLVLVSCLLFAGQPVVARRLRSGGTASRRHRVALHLGTFAASVYGAYFGAGLGIVLLAVLATSLPDSLTRINGLRSVLALLVNTVAVVVFVLGAHVAWAAAGILAATAVVGGFVGARVARRLPPVVLRVLVVAIGLATAIGLLVR